MRRLRNIIREERGQAATEFAIVLPLLAIVLFGLIQAGITFNHYVTLTDAVRAGGRAASVATDQGSAQTAALQAMQSAAGDLTLESPAATPVTTWASGNQVQVTAKVPYSITLLGVTVASGYLTSTTVQRIE